MKRREFLNKTSLGVAAAVVVPGFALTHEETVPNVSPEPCRAEFGSKPCGDIVTTNCYLLKITPANGKPYGATSLDKDIVYDDGEGILKYKASWAHGSVYQLGGGILRQASLSGDNYTVYRVNWKDLSMGHMVIQRGGSYPYPAFKHNLFPKSIGYTLNES